MDMKEVNLPSSIELILLFILGFPGSSTKRYKSLPAIAVETELVEPVLLLSIEFSSHLAPQDIKVRIQIFEDSGRQEKHVELELITGPSVAKFPWEDWINPVMGVSQSEGRCLE